MTTVYYNRAKDNPDQIHDLLFLHDKGGASVFDDLSNVNVRICSPNRIEGFVKDITRRFSYKEIRITTAHEVIKWIDTRSDSLIVYEFHTPFRSQMEREIPKLDIHKVDIFAAPSQNSARMLSEVLPQECLPKISVRQNLLDKEYLEFKDDVDPFIWNNSIPILWIGRFDDQKNVNDFLRILSLLPDVYHGISVVSFNDDVTSFSDFMGDVYAYRLEKRLSVLLNLSKRQIRSLYHSVREAGGVFLSTSVDESFGYTVAEAAALRLPTITFDVGALSEHDSPQIKFIPVGDNVGAKQEIVSLCARK
ncbi:glycosyltransferase involved in cell wall biosynthesis [Ochrobactrum daejeonense]|uniref:Glycosyltransferase involved in cell wall biosynthesis n=1 Tax=Brucella daejeonensis TaxID=659015 RepID=A0A7W9B2I1_9HYPH|nr:glycosyltransferase [Brucella daejeonensis]MBB5704644.1 glycosyltransferase involved in cell wall biosynthesis [Brucella daejeonensis]